MTAVRSPGARLLLLGPVAALLAGAAAPAQEAVFDDVVEVIRLEIEVRVLDRRGEPIPGLGPADFEVTLDGVPVAVEAVDRPGEPPPPREPGATEPEETAAAPALPRLVVLFFQRHALPSRARGLMRMAHEARALVRELGPGDLAAVVSFGPPLHVHTDFTGDRDLLLAALDSVAPFRAVELRDERPQPLTVRLPPRTAAGVRTVERSLELLAHLLEPLPGAKSLLFFGWGLGELSGGAVRAGPDLRRARAVLARGKTAFFALDVTQADHHTLEALLHELAHDTGGRFLRTFHQPAGTMAAATAALAGHYRLTLVPPAGLGLEGELRLEVGLRGTPGEVLHPAKLTFVPATR
ncbi:MAG TPA: VWA domain-containing protein [Thermoanaerobaculia bacterium]|nr:VWA domain-containing protein [Thermoanaerobaculia bacterium]